MKKYGLLTFWLLTFIGIVLLTFISNRMFSHDCKIETIRKNGIIRFGIALRPPFSYLASDSTPTGVSVETARMVAERLGIKKHEFQTRSFDSLLDWLSLDDFDVMAEMMFATHDRSLKADFSAPYLKLSTSLLVKQGNPLGLHSYADIIKSNARVMFFKGTFQEKWAIENIHNDRLLMCLTPEHSVSAFEKDEVDAYMAVIPICKATMEKSAVPLELVIPTEEFHPALLEPPLACFAFEKGQKHLLEQWNQALQEVLKSPEYLELLKKYGFSDQDLP